MTILPTSTPASPAVRRAAESLRRLCGGHVHVAGDAGYDAARAARNPAVDQRPAAVAHPRSAADVSEVVRAAAAAGLRVAPQSTGRHAGPLAAQDLSDVVLVRTARMNGVDLDTGRRVLRVGSGAVWLPAVEAAAEHGLAALHGSSPEAGVAGHCLGGGLGWFARKHGLATSSLTAVELVLADGSQVRVDANHDPELFWALRGGGGSFGVATALELSLLRIASAYAGMLVWDAEAAERVLRRWAAWAPEAPEEVTSSWRILRMPCLPRIPAQLRGRSVVVVEGAVLGTDVRGREVLAELRALAPEVDTFDRVPASSLLHLHLGHVNHVNHLRTTGTTGTTWTTWPRKGRRPSRPTR